uniref:Putative beta-glucosidase 41 n=1 Tax=Noccaea caerulescens TaxID=107243 RepID=A0A1J3I578_NOCCA
MKETKDKAYGTLSRRNQVSNKTNAENSHKHKPDFSQFNVIVLDSTGKILDFSNADTTVDQYHRFHVSVLTKKPLFDLSFKIKVVLLLQRATSSKQN